MRDLLLCVHVVVKTLNLEISRCRLVDYVKECYLSACRACSTIIFLHNHSTNQIIVFSCCRCRCCRPCLNSLIAKRERNDPFSMIEHARLNTCQFNSKIGSKLVFLVTFWLIVRLTKRIRGDDPLLKG